MCNLHNMPFMYVLACQRSAVLLPSGTDPGCLKGGWPALRERSTS